MRTTAYDNPAVEIDCADVGGGGDRSGKTMGPLYPPMLGTWKSTEDKELNGLPTNLVKNDNSENGEQEDTEKEKKKKKKRKQKDDDEKWKARRWTQHLAAILATLSSASVGYVDGWTANALPFLMQPHNESLAAIFSTANQSSFFSTPERFDSNRTANGFVTVEGIITEEQGSWLSSLVAVGALLASLPAGMLADYVGRKGALVLMSLPSASSWIMILLGSHSVVWLCTSRLLAGAVMGVVSVVVPLYNEEISEVRVRGALGVYQNMMVSVGLLTVYTCGALCSYGVAALVPIVFPMATCVFFTFMPESPVHLLANGRVEKAHDSLRFLRGPWCDTKREAALLQPLVDRATQKLDPGAPSAVKQLWRDLVQTGRGGRRGLLVAFALMALRQLTGVNAVAFHAVELLQGGGSVLSASRAAIVLGAVEVAATFLASRVVDHVGRRPLLQLSSAGTAVCHACLAVYFASGCCRSGDGPWWPPLLLLSAFNVLYSLGMGPLPWLMMAELIPTEHKRWATGFTGFLNWAFMFFVLKLFTEGSRAMGRAVTFGLLSACCTGGAIFVTCVVPETKGKTLTEIQGEMGSSSPSAAAVEESSTGDVDPSAAQATQAPQGEEEEATATATDAAIETQEV